MRIVTLLALLVLSSLASAAMWCPVIDYTGNSFYLSESLNQSMTAPDAAMQIATLNAITGYSDLYFMPTYAQLQAGEAEDGLPIFDSQWWQETMGNSGTAYWRLGMRALAMPHDGDANNDGRVDVVDLGILAKNYDGFGKSWGEGDFTVGGLVDVVDLGILAKNYDWVGTPPSDVMLPEPCVFGLMLGLLVLGHKRGRATSI
jgi:hypothetical protein